MTFSQSLNMLSSNCVISVDRNCVLLLLFFLPALIDKDKIPAVLCDELPNFSLKYKNNFTAKETTPKINNNN